MNDKEQMVWLLVGAPGSGKSTYGKNMCEEDKTIVRVCPDEFRAIFGWGEGDQSVSAKAFEATRLALGEHLDKGMNVIVDATNMYRKSRKDFINIAREHGAKVTALVFECDRETLVERNVNRGASGGRNVPEHIIDNMLAKYEGPNFDEFDFIRVITGTCPSDIYFASRE